MAELKYRIEQKKGLKGIIQLNKLFGFLILLLCSFFFSNAVFSQSQTFDYTGSNQTFTVPSGVTSITVEAWGGGGAGGGPGSNRNARAGGGGAAYVKGTINTTAGTNYTVVIGRGGANETNNGAVTTFGNASTFSADYGRGGGSNGNSPGAAGTAGASVVTGSATGVVKTSGNVGGDRSGSTGGNGGDAGNTTGTGGAGHSGNNGSSGSAPGGGGAGAGTSSSGGSGGNGRVIVTWTACIPPTAYSVTGGGDYCVGGSGKAVGLSNSESGVNYQLKLNGTNTGLAVSGSGAAISFGNKTSAGTYTVEATRVSGGCTNTMSGNVAISINPLPTASVSDQSNISCYGGSDGTITVNASGGTNPYTFSINNGANYFNATGTDLRLFTGLLPNTPYTIKVKDSNGCTSN